MSKLTEKSIGKLEIDGSTYHYYSLKALEEEGYEIKKLPFSIKVLLESVLRQCDDYMITEDHIRNLADWRNKRSKAEVPFKPARVILQDFTGVPAILDLAAMRSAILEYRQENVNFKAEKYIGLINPQVQVDLVIDHSLQVDAYGNHEALMINTANEFERNQERYQFLNWAEKSFDNFKVIPPSNGIVHQVNLEYLAMVVLKQEENGRIVLCPETLIGTDSHTTMINGLSVLGWGVGGIEAEAGMLGQPSYLQIPEVVGVRITGSVREGVTATDIALRLTKLLRDHGVVNKFVEYFGDGVKELSLADRATIANMSPEYGATCAFFPADEVTLDYLRFSGRSEEHVNLVKTYLKENVLFNEYTYAPVYTEVLTLNLSTVSSSLAGPKRPQDLIPLEDMKNAFLQSVTKPHGNQGHGLELSSLDQRVEINLPDGRSSTMETGSIVIAAITSCTNTSNPAVMLGAGLLAKNAVKAGLNVPAHVKTSLTPGSKIVSEYLEHSGMQQFLDELGFQVAGYGCATCIGNSGPLRDEISNAVTENDMLVASVLSGNRNFEGRIHPLVKANYLASPPLVVAYAIAGTINIDLLREPLGRNSDGKDIYLKDIWPKTAELSELIAKYVTPDLFQKVYKEIYHGNDLWNEIKEVSGKIYEFNPSSTYIKKPPFFDNFSLKENQIENISGLRVLAVFGDSITTDHISPAGSIGNQTPAADYLRSHGFQRSQFNTYGSRRGNHEVMIRGTFANLRIRNRIVPESEGGYTIYWPENKVMTIYDACMRYKEDKTGLLVFAGKDYGMGSSRDWAAKGPSLLGVKAVIAESYERIHRSNLVMMGILPLQFIEGENVEVLGLNSDDVYDIRIGDTIKPKDKIDVIAISKDGHKNKFQVIVRFDSEIELDYYRNGGILPMVLRQKLRSGI